MNLGAMIKYPFFPIIFIADKTIEEKPSQMLIHTCWKLNLSLALCPSRLATACEASITHLRAGSSWLFCFPFRFMQMHTGSRGYWLKSLGPCCL